MDNGEKAVE